MIDGKPGSSADWNIIQPGRISISTAWLQLLLWLQFQHQHQLQLQWHFCFWASWCLRCLTEELYAGLPAAHYSKGSRIHMKVAYGSPPILRDSLWIKAHFKYCFTSIIHLSDMIILRHAREYERASFFLYHSMDWGITFCGLGSALSDLLDLSGLNGAFDVGTNSHIWIIQSWFCLSSCR